MKMFFGLLIFAVLVVIFLSKSDGCNCGEHGDYDCDSKPEDRPVKWR